ncbi:hypothetical protein [Actinomadura hibisca]|uniref:hypothetical protein n=1 Tax=Actinomadura hibisca TaxID=68565 RepID=UPI0008347C0C|nr:hypothetical protein [Actinomadura hibisca]
MADSFELLLSAELPPSLSADEVAELSWHTGAGPQPDALTIVSDFTEVFVDDDGRFEYENLPRPLLGPPRAAWRIGGVCHAALLPKEKGGWALSARQELHPDDFDLFNGLLRWLKEHATAFACHTRFYEEEDFAPVRDGRLVF